MTAWVAVIQPFVCASERLVFWTASTPAADASALVSLRIQRSLAQFLPRDEARTVDVGTRVVKRQEGPVLEQTSCGRLQSKANVVAPSVTALASVRVHSLLGAGWVPWRGVYRHGLRVIAENNAELWVLLPFHDDETYDGDGLDRVEFTPAASVTALSFVPSTSSHTLRISPWCEVARFCSADKSEQYEFSVSSVFLSARFDPCNAGMSRYESSFLDRPNPDMTSEHEHLSETVRTKGREPVAQHGPGDALGDTTSLMTSSSVHTGAEALRQQLRRRLDAEIEAWLEFKILLMRKATLARRVVSRFAALNVAKSGDRSIDHSSASAATHVAASLTEQWTHAVVEPVSTVGHVSRGVETTGLDWMKSPQSWDRLSPGSKPGHRQGSMPATDGEKILSDALLSGQDTANEGRHPRLMSDDDHRLHEPQTNLGSVEVNGKKDSLRLELVQQRLLWSLNSWHAVVQLSRALDRRRGACTLPGQEPWHLVVAAPLCSVDVTSCRCTGPAASVRAGCLRDMVAPAHQVSGRRLSIALVTDPPHAQCYNAGSICVPGGASTFMDSEYAQDCGANSTFALSDCYEIIVAYPLGLHHPETNLCHWWQRLCRTGLASSRQLEVQGIVEPAFAVIVLKSCTQALGLRSTPMRGEHSTEALLGLTASRIRGSLPVGARVIAAGRVSTALRLLEALESLLQPLCVGLLKSQHWAHDLGTAAETPDGAKNRHDASSITSQHIAEADILMALLQETLPFIEYTGAGS